MSVPKLVDALNEGTGGNTVEKLEEALDLGYDRYLIMTSALRVLEKIKFIELDKINDLRYTKDGIRIIDLKEINHSEDILSYIRPLYNKLMEEREAYVKEKRSLSSKGEFKI